jgi:hypothetical protein
VENRSPADTKYIYKTGSDGVDVGHHDADVVMGRVRVKFRCRGSGATGSGSGATGGVGFCALAWDSVSEAADPGPSRSARRL